MAKSKLTAERPGLRHEIDQAVARVTTNLGEEANGGPAVNTAGKANIQAIDDGPGQVIGEKVGVFAESGRFEEMVATLARACNLPLAFVEKALSEEAPETTLILAKSAKLSWTTAKALLSLRTGAQRNSTVKLDQCMASFERLNFATAQQIVHFWRRREQQSSDRHASRTAQSKQ